MSSNFINALLLQSGYNAALVAIGATLLGIAAGSGGTFLFLRKRALVSDAVAHATLPGVGIAFMLMVAFGGDGRSLIGLLLGSAISAGIGLLIVEWISRRTRLAEDAAIGAVLSVFFGLGIVLLTIIQTMSRGKQAGLEGFLLGSTAGMLFQDAVVIAIGGALSVLAVIMLRRPMTLVAFDPEFAAASGVNVRRIDLAMMGLVMAVTVIGLKLVGLILVVAMLIIPPVTARFWTDRTDHVIWIAGAVGGLSGYIGTALSASAPKMPTGPIIVIVCFALFALSLLLAPNRGVLAAVFRHLRFQRRVHMRQGLLALAHQEQIFDPLTIRVLRRAGLIRADSVATAKGKALASKTLRDEKRWEVARQIHQDDVISGRYDGLTPIEAILTRDEISEIDRHLGPPVPATA
ncbi:metal ABC transporter permease [Nitratireductor sp. OM-1]|uniref:metal ABC transporter permease n=1 Tax=Nitratireductor sp. OM-1 TaxID=1756988 RepID=UPI000DDD0143|nr:iron chelate uptake ABC transporter family permease subunit [Nitratireductor sp. OM-1]